MCMRERTLGIFLDLDYHYISKLHVVFPHITVSELFVVYQYSGTPFRWIYAMYTVYIYIYNKCFLLCRASIMNDVICGIFTIINRIHVLLQKCVQNEYVATGCMAGTSIVIERSALKWPLALLV